MAQASLADLAIDAVFVLSVKTFADRIAHVTRELGRFGIPFEFIFDFDAAELDDATILTYFVAGTSPMKKQASLTLKHLQAWRLADARGARRVMVFEDDVVLHPAFHARLAAAMRAADGLAPGWHIFLGGADAKVPDRFFVHSGPLVPLASTTAEGYVSDLEACRRRLAWCAANKIRHPADTLTFADSAQANTFEAPASISNPMFEEWYYLDLETNYANPNNQPNGHFRHSQKANVTFADGHVALEKAVAGSYDKRLSNQFIGQLRPEILTLP